MTEASRWTLDRKLAVDQVTTLLRDKILSGELAAGSALRESRLAPLVGVSRNTVREACRSLVAEGLVVHHPHRGFAVAALSAEDVDDVYALRRRLELAAVREAFEAMGERLPRLREHVHDLREVALGGRYREAIEADLRFHAELVSTLGSRRLVDAFRQACDELRPLLATLDRAERDPEALVAEHEELIGLIAAGDRGGLARRLKRHLEETRQRMVAAIERRDEGSA